jgi:hypothetical protein
MNCEKIKRSDRPDRFRSLLFTLGSARAVLVVALVYSFPDVFNVIMALISPYTNQPFIVLIRRTSIVSWDHLANGLIVFLSITLKFILSLVSRGLGLFKVILIQVCSWICENIPMHILLSNETWIYLFVVALVYFFPDVCNVIMALISPYTNQPFIVPIRWTSIVS